jgi:hypothetical protein
MAGLYSITTRGAGTVLTASIYNADHVNHRDNHIPSMIDDESSDVTAMRVTADPFPAGAASLPTSLQGELHRLRYVLADMGEELGNVAPDYWYAVKKRAPAPVRVTFLGVAAVTAKWASVLIDAPGVIKSISIYADTAPTGAALILDVNLNGTSIWAATPANRVQIAAAANAGSQTSFDTTAVAAGDRLTFDIDQIGSGTAGGNDLLVVVTFQGATK